MYTNIADILFDSPAGSWEFHVCLACESGYLKTRPTEATVGLAYRNYYTHGAQRLVSAELEENVIINVKLNIFSNRSLAVIKKQTINFIKLILNFTPILRWSIKNSYRHLPQATSGCNNLLDVGCGDGRFMSLAESLGWRTLGIDTDGLAVEKCLINGLRAKVGDISLGSLNNNYYDVVTCSHVIEHVHDPILFFSFVTSKIKQGGILWIQTPNVKSLGHQKFNEYWRGLETPRHLVLFNVHSLRRLLESYGYEVKQMPWNIREVNDVYRQSIILKNSGIKYSMFRRFILACEILKDSLIEWIQPDRREFITFKAIKR